MGNKGGEGGIEDRPAAFPSEHHGLFTIVETFLRYPTIILEGILMSSNQAVKVTVGRKVNVLPSGEAQDIGKALYLALTGPGEGDRIGTPIHLTLLSRFGFKPYDRFSFRDPQLFDPFPQNADPPGITRFLQLLVDPQARDVGVSVQELLDLRVESVEFARPPEPFGQHLMTPVPPLGMGPQNPPDGVTP